MFLSWRINYGQSWLFRNQKAEIYYRINVYLNLHNKFINVLFDRFRFDRDFRRFLDHVGTAEPRDLRFRVRLALAFHGDQRAGLVRDNARFLDEGRGETRALLCILERSMIRHRRKDVRARASFRCRGTENAILRSPSRLIARRGVAIASLATVTPND